MKLKKGDNVIVIAGKSKGEKGAIVRAFPRDNMVLIDGVNLVKRHRKPTQESRKGQIIDKPMPIHVSNVQLADPRGGKPTRIKIVRGKDGARSRVAVGSGQEIK
ncbi:50S ribosomal protein L24 [Candidatus Kaiserbacteria bacterium]|nr:50S ribosomal protein L24 [Candidatus Kaiserbacteria bacterium]